MKKNLLLNKRGTVMVTVMGIVLILMIVAIAANENVNMDISNSMNHLNTVRSLYIAEAGLERAKSECVTRFIQGGLSNFSSILRGSDNTAGTSDDNILSFGSSVSFYGGTYEVKVYNDSKDTGGQFNDTNNSITIESTGTYRGFKTRLHATIKINKISNINSSVTLLGEADTSFSGTSFKIDGRDYRLSDTDTPTGPSEQAGINLANSSHRLNVINSLSDDQKSKIMGTGYDGTTTPATPSIGISTAMTIEDARSFIDSVKAIADNKLLNPTSLDDINIGTTANPKVTYINKTDATAIKITGNTSGAGILVIEGGNLEITLTGNMSWTGIIVVIGRSVGFKQTGSGEIKGGLVVAELSDPDVGKELEVGGNFSIKYSSEAITMANNALLNKKAYSVVSWQKVY